MADIVQVLKLISQADNSGIRSIEGGLSGLESTGSRIGSVLTHVFEGIAIAGAAAAAGIVAGLGLAVHAAEDFQSAMLKVGALTDTNAQQLEQYNKQVLDLSTRMPASAKELADGLFFVVSAGFKGAEAMNILETSAKASAAGMGSVKVVADAVTSTLNAYNLKASDATHVTDILAEAITQGKVSADELAPAIGRVLPLAAAAGVNFEQVAASMAAMTRSGLDARESATAFRAALGALEKPTKQTEEALSAMGLTSGQVIKSIKDNGFLETLRALYSASGGDLELLGKLIPNIRAFTGVLTDVSDQTIAKTQDILVAIQNSAGKTEDAFQKAQQTVAVQMKELRNTVSAIFIEIGQGLLPPITAALGAVRGFLKSHMDDIVAFVNDGVHFITSLVQNVAGFLMQFASGVASAFKTIFGGLGTSNVAGTFFTLISQGIVLLAQFGRAVNDWLFGPLINTTQGLMRTGGAFNDFLRLIRDDVLPVLGQFAGWITNVVAPAIANFISRDVITHIGEVVNAIKGIFSFAQQNVVPPIFDAIRSVIQFVSDHKEILAGVAIAIGAIWAGIQAWGLAMAALNLAPFVLVVGLIGGIAAGIIDLVRNWDQWTQRYPVILTIRDALLNIWVAVQNIVQEVIHLAQQAVPPVLEAIKNAVQFVADHWNVFGPLAAGILATVGAFILLQQAVSVIGGIITAISALNPWLVGAAIAITAITFAVIEVKQHWDEWVARWPQLNTLLDLVQTIGQFFLDLGIMLGTAAAKAYELLAPLLSNREVLEAIGITLGIVAAAFLVLTGVVIAETVVMWGLAAATTAVGVVMAAIASPIGIAVAAIFAISLALLEINKHADEIRTGLTAAFDAVKNAVGEAAQFIVSHLSEIGTVVAGVILAPFAPIIALATDAFGIRTALKHGWDAIVKDAEDVGGNIVSALANSIYAGYEKLPGPIKFIVDRVADLFRLGLQIASPSQVMMDIGQNVTAGLVVGLTSAAILAQVGTAVGGVSQYIIGTFQSQLGISSPSTVTAYFGQMMTGGVAVGMRDNVMIRAVTDAIQSVSNLVTDGSLQQVPQETYRLGMAAGAQYAAGISQTKEQVAAAAKVLHDAMTQQVGPQLPSDARQNAEDYGLGIAKGLADSLPDVSKSAKELGLAQGDSLQKPKDAYDGASKYIQSYINGIKDAEPAAARQMQDILDTVTSFVKQHPGSDTAYDWGIKVIQALEQGINTHKDTVAQAMGNVETLIRSFPDFQGTSKDKFNQGVEIVQQLIDGIDDKHPELRKKMQDQLDLLKATANDKDTRYQWYASGLNGLGDVVKGMTDMYPNLRVLLGNLQGDFHTTAQNVQTEMKSMLTTVVTAAQQVAAILGFMQKPGTIKLPELPPLPGMPGYDDKGGFKPSSSLPGMPTQDDIDKMLAKFSDANAALASSGENAGDAAGKGVTKGLTKHEAEIQAELARLGAMIPAEITQAIADNELQPTVALYKVMVEAFDRAKDEVHGGSAETAAMLADLLAQGITATQALPSAAFVRTVSQMFVLAGDTARGGSAELAQVLDQTLAAEIQATGAYPSDSYVKVLGDAVHRAGNTAHGGSVEVATLLTMTLGDVIAQTGAYPSDKFVQSMTEMLLRASHITGPGAKDLATTLQSDVARYIEATGQEPSDAMLRSLTTLTARAAATSADGASQIADNYTTLLAQYVTDNASEPDQATQQMLATVMLHGAQIAHDGGMAAGKAFLDALASVSNEQGAGPDAATQRLISQVVLRGAASMHDGGEQAGQAFTDALNAWFDQTGTTMPSGLQTLIRQTLFTTDGQLRQGGKDAATHMMQEMGDIFEQTGSVPSDALIKVYESIEARLGNQTHDMTGRLGAMFNGDLKLAIDATGNLPSEAWIKVVGDALLAASDTAHRGSVQLATDMNTTIANVITETQQIPSEALTKVIINALDQASRYGEPFARETGTLIDQFIADQFAMTGELPSEALTKVISDAILAARRYGEPEVRFMAGELNGFIADEFDATGQVPSDALVKTVADAITAATRYGGEHAHEIADTVINLIEFALDNDVTISDAAVKLVTKTLARFEDTTRGGSPEAGRQFMSLLAESIADNGEMLSDAAITETSKMFAVLTNQFTDSETRLGSMFMEGLINAVRNSNEPLTAAVVQVIGDAMLAGDDATNKGSYDIAQNLSENFSAYIKANGGDISDSLASTIDSAIETATNAGANATQIGQLIDDLLAYAITNNGEVPKKAAEQLTDDILGIFNAGMAKVASSISGSFEANNKTIQANADAMRKFNDSENAKLPHDAAGHLIGGFTTQNTGQKAGTPPEMQPVLDALGIILKGLGVANDAANRAALASDLAAKGLTAQQFISQSLNIQSAEEQHTISDAVNTMTQSDSNMVNRLGAGFAALNTAAGRLDPGNLASAFKSATQDTLSHLPADIRAATAPDVQAINDLITQYQAHPTSELSAQISDHMDALIGKLHDYQVGADDANKAIANGVIVQLSKYSTAIDGQTGQLKQFAQFDRDAILQLENNNNQISKLVETMVKAGDLDRLLAGTQKLGDSVSGSIGVGIANLGESFTTQLVNLSGLSGDQLKVGKENLVKTYSSLLALLQKVPGAEPVINNLNNIMSTLVRSGTIDINIGNVATAQRQKQLSAADQTAQNTGQTVMELQKLNANLGSTLGGLQQEISGLASQGGNGGGDGGYSFGQGGNGLPSFKDMMQGNLGSFNSLQDFIAALRKSSMDPGTQQKFIDYAINTGQYPYPSGSGIFYNSGVEPRTDPAMGARFRQAMQDWNNGLRPDAPDINNPATYMAEGGIVTRPTNIVAGEGSQPEAVLPLTTLFSTLRDMGQDIVVATNTSADRVTGVLSEMLTHVKELASTSSSGPGNQSMTVAGISGPPGAGASVASSDTVQGRLTRFAQTQSGPPQLTPEEAKAALAKISTNTKDTIAGINTGNTALKGISKSSLDTVSSLNVLGDTATNSLNGIGSISENTGVANDRLQMIGGGLRNGFNDITSSIGSLGKELQGFGMISSGSSSDSGGMTDIGGSVVAKMGIVPGMSGDLSGGGGDCKPKGMGMVMSSISSMAEGGTLMEPVHGIGLYSGRGYNLAEAGWEDVVPRGKGSKATTQHNYYLSDGAIQLRVEDLAQINDVVDFFERIPQAARAMGIRTKK